MPHYNLLVIGGDAAGMGAASQARRIDKDLSICVLEKGEFISYAACGMPYYIGGDIPDYKPLLIIDKDEFTKKRNIRILTGTEAISADTVNKTVKARSASGDETFTYDRLVIATGASAAMPPIKGIDLQGVMILKNLSDGIRIRRYIESAKPRSVIIVGGGLIGLELAEAFGKNGINVQIIEKAESVAPLFSPEIRKTITETLSYHGINPVTGAGVSEIQSSGNGLKVITDKGDFTADFAVVSTGVRPNTAFLKDPGIDMLANGAIIVDEKCRTSAESVWAAGDCATVKNLVSGKTDYIPVATNANKQGRVAGLQAAGVSGEVFRGAIGTQFVKVFEIEAAKTGFNRIDAEKHGINVIDEFIEWKSRAGYYPGAEKVNVKLTVREDNRKVIGGEISGLEGAALRINAVAVAVTAGMTVEDLAYADFGYSPPFAPVWDPVIATAQNFIRRTKSG